MSALAANPSAGLYQKLNSVSKRETRLWSFGVAILLVFAAGFLILALPSLIWTPGVVRAEVLHRVQLVLGLASLILIFAGYVFDQNRTHHKTRDELIHEIIFAERMESFSLVDPLTQLFNRSYLDVILPKEMRRANRSGAPLTFLLLEVDRWTMVGRRAGEMGSDLFLLEAAKLLKTTFRGSDTILRYGDHKFLAILPDTDQYQAGIALRRFLGRVDSWNLESDGPYEMAFNGGMAMYSNQIDVAPVLEDLERSIVQNRTQLVAAD
jgi:diguanylate cyclase (GGDEF)-like protein